LLKLQLQTLNDYLHFNRNELRKMKTFASIFMGLLIVAGLVLALTPIVGSIFFPVPENTVRQAKPDAAAMALKQWFQSPDAQFIAVQAINKTSTKNNVKQNTSWFSFSVGRRPVEKYIINKKLTQLDLSSEILNSVFTLNDRPASWWQPEALAQKSYFTGHDQGRLVSLIYSPKSKRGILITTTEN